MIHENLYKDFAENAYNEGKDLYEAIKEEIKQIFYDYSTSTVMNLDNAIDSRVERIMKLISETKYEW